MITAKDYDTINTVNNWTVWHRTLHTVSRSIRKIPVLSTPFPLQCYSRHWMLYNPCHWYVSFQVCVYRTVRYTGFGKLDYSSCNASFIKSDKVSSAVTLQEHEDWAMNEPSEYWNCIVLYLRNRVWMGSDVYLFSSETPIMLVYQIILHHIPEESSVQIHGSPWTWCLERGVVCDSSLVWSI